MAKKTKRLTPSFKDLIEPVYISIKGLGGSANNNEIRDSVIAMLDLPDEVVDEPHKGAQRAELEYQLAWARTYLKNYGAIANTDRGVWMVTVAFAEVSSVQRDEVLKIAAAMRSKNKNAATQETNLSDDDPANDGLEVPDELEPWRTDLANTLHNMDPFAFERLAQLLLRECGFSQVSVTKKTGDGGIDGTGKLRINGIFSFNVAFQCKRFIGSVSAGDIRDFRGSLTTDIEKGVLITTGTFTKAAREEASNAGKQQIDLIDGEEFINKLIEYRIGVKDKVVFEVDHEFFESV